MEYVYFNNNPKKRKTTDCVVRAISLAINSSWEAVYMALHSLGFDMKEMANSKKCYEKFLKKAGHEKEKMPRFPDNTRYTVKEFIEAHPRMSAVLRVSRHLTVIKEGKLYDTWDCSEKSVGNYWVMSKE